jgi:hypothetical protein
VVLENLLDTPLSTLETVAIETPALAATVAMELDALRVGLGVFGRSLGVIKFCN